MRICSYRIVLGRLCPGEGFSVMLCPGSFKCISALEITVTFPFISRAPLEIALA